MKNQMYILSLLFGCALILLCSCANIGTKFDPPDVNQLQLGKLEPKEAIALFGQPYSTGKKTTSDGDFEIYKYAYTQVNFGEASQRMLLLEFKGGKLNAYFNWSSFNQDKTKFDPEIERKLKVGVAKFTKDQVEAMAGKPDGRALCPSMVADFKEKCAKNTEVWGWYMKDSINLWGPQNVKTTELFVSFDAAGKVSDVEVEETTDPNR